MRVIKFTSKRKDRVGQLVKVGSVQFDDRPDWMLVKDLDRAWYDAELRWVHPSEVLVHWVHDFSL